MNTAASLQDQEMMKWMMKPSEFALHMSHIMERLERQLAKAKMKQEEKMLDLYRKNSSI